MNNEKSREKLIKIPQTEFTFRKISLIDDIQIQNEQNEDLNLLD